MKTGLLTLRGFRARSQHRLEGDAQILDALTLCHLRLGGVSAPMPTRQHSWLWILNSRFEALGYCVSWSSSAAINVSARIGTARFKLEITGTHLLMYSSFAPQPTSGSVRRRIGTLTADIFDAFSPWAVRIKASTSVESFESTRLRRTAAAEGEVLVLEPQATMLELARDALFGASTHERAPFVAGRCPESRQHGDAQTTVTRLMCSLMLLSTVAPVS